MPREGTAADIRWFEVQPCYVFHPLNAYDDDDRVVLDVVRHPTVFADGPGFAVEPRTLDRWTVDLGAGTVREERFDDRSQEFPRVDERLVSRRHRYGYAVGYGPESAPLTAPDVILKHDLVKQSTQPVSFGPGREPSEFVFVPNAADAAEDDGVAMGFVYDRATDRSDLVLLDAQTLQTVATVHLPARVPNGFHGNWVPTER
jgi:carotenoid cleavage dioxygenase